MTHLVPRLKVGNNNGVNNEVMKLGFVSTNLVFNFQPMRNLYMLICLFLFLNGCALNNVAEITSEREAISQHDEYNEEAQKLHYILLKIPANQRIEYKEAILRTNKEIGFASLKLTTLLIGKPTIQREHYILFRRFQSFDEANEYVQLLLESSSLRGLEGMMVVTQEGYRKFNRDKSS